MVKQIVLPILGVVAFIVLVSLFVKKSSQPNFKLPTFNQVQAQKIITVSGKDINVEVAKTPEARINGLSGRESLEADSGMLFVFDSKGVKPLFWMKDMKFPIDIIWISEGKIVSINKNVLVADPNTPDRNLPVYSSGQPVDYILEVNAGFSDANNIKVGDEIQMQFDPEQS